MNENLEDLTNKLKHLAKHHAREFGLHERKKTQVAINEFNLAEIANTIKSLDFFKAFDTATIMQAFENLQTSLNDLLNSSVLTKSETSGEFMPVSFDALIEIFTFSNEKFRQQNFQQLISLYYEELYKCLRSLNCEQMLTKVKYNLEIKIFLPLVILKIASQWLRGTNYVSKEMDQLLSNIGYYFKFYRLNQEDIYEVVRNKIGSTNYHFKSYELLPMDGQNGHLGEYFKLKIAIGFEKEHRDFELFVKFLNPKITIMKQLVLSGPSKKEEFFYMTYMPLLEKHGLKSLLSFVPKCYFSRLNDVLILDNMAANGFVGLTPNILLEYDALLKVVQQIAKLHASAMLLEEILSDKTDKRVTIYDLFAEFLQEAFFVPEDDYFFKLSLDMAVATMPYIALKFPEITKNFSKDVLKDKIKKGWNLHFEKIKKSKNLKNTLCHGDMYVANILFKFTEDKVCQDVSVIDFQLLRYCPPTHDLLFFLYQGSTKEIRNKYLKQLYEEYYKELTKHTEKFGFNIENVYPKDDFEISLKYMKSQAVFQALYYSPITMLPPKLREDIFSDQEQANYFLNQYRWKLVDIGLEDDNYRTVLKGLVEDLVELCENGDL